MTRWAMRPAVPVLALLLAGCEAARAGRPPAVGDPVPAYSATSLDGAQVSLEKLRGTPVLLNVWATWCHPCRREMPALQQLHREFGPAGLRVVGVSIDQGGQQQGIREFLAEFGADYEVWLDPDERVGSTFATIGVPTTFLVDRKGTLLWTHVGPVAADDRELRRLIAQSLAAS
ncbi:MAG TPA: TlpA disulfide reductase family protein [Longimicrobium sp.]|nr:TlpA disulfide reductase family protein [Longimicrobium sp.]